MPLWLPLPASFFFLAGLTLFLILLRSYRRQNWRSQTSFFKKRVKL
jgi:uncharacterized membrane protein